MVIFSCAIKSDWYFIQNLLQLYIMTVFTHLKQLYFRTCGRQVSKVIDNDPHPCIIPSPWEWWESENRWDVTPLILLQYMAKGSCNYYRIGKWVDIILEEADPVRWAFKNMVSSLTVCVLAAQSCLTLCDPWTVAHQAPPSMRFSDKNTGVGCYFLLHICIYVCIYISVYKKISRPVMSDSLQSMDYSPPGSSVHGILQARILEWIAISFSRGSSSPRDWTQVSCIAGRFFTIIRHEPPGKPISVYTEIHKWNI